MKQRKPLDTMPRTASTRDENISGRLSLRQLTRADQAASSSDQSSNDPSWPPQAAAKR
ncbi:hypothetical protein D3C80_2187490 [compost metagenome]